MDKHRAYPAAIRAVEGLSVLFTQISSRRARTPSNPLFPINLADLLLRHTSANHKRETIAFSKRRQGALYRAAIWLVWRNYQKSRSERRRDPPPAVSLGLIPRRLSTAEILRKRLFVWRNPLSGWLRECYFARIPTRCLASTRTHAAKLAV
jgi:hypothetical protein